MSTGCTSVGIVGVGCVGGAVYKYYSQRDDVDVIGYDKFKEGFNNDANFDKILCQDIVFLCLPTLYSETAKEYDKTAIHEVCAKLNRQKYKGLVVLKSTVEPGTTEQLSKKYECLDFAHNPEFLTARTAYTDFMNQSHIVLGKTDKCDEKKFVRLEKFMRFCWPDSRYSICMATESESMKSFCNCFYAMKISIFNEYYLMCKHMGMDYKKVLSMMLKNNWINEMHTNVPGPDGYYGYGGMCFPKDMGGLYQHMKRNNLPHNMLKASLCENKELRKLKTDYIKPLDTDPNHVERVKLTQRMLKSKSEKTPNDQCCPLDCTI